MANLRIKNFEIVRERNTFGRRTLARFDAHIAGIVLAGCTLSLLTDGKLVGLPPKAKAHDGQRKAVWIENDDLRHDFTAIAIKLYEARTGERLDEMPRSTGLPHPILRPGKGA